MNRWSRFLGAGIAAVTTSVLIAGPGEGKKSGGAVAFFHQSNVNGEIEPCG